VNRAMREGSGKACSEDCGELLAARPRTIFVLRNLRNKSKLLRRTTARLAQFDPQPYGTSLVAA
jgi:hypothetical protein